MPAIWHNCSFRFSFPQCLGKTGCMQQVSSVSEDLAQANREAKSTCGLRSLEISRYRQVWQSSRPVTVMFGDGDASRYFARVSRKTWNLETSGISPQIANKAIACYSCGRAHDAKLVN